MFSEEEKSFFEEEKRKIEPSKKLPKIEEKKFLEKPATEEPFLLKERLEERKKLLAEAEKKKEEEEKREKFLSSTQREKKELKKEGLLGKLWRLIRGLFKKEKKESSLAQDLLMAFYQTKDYSDRKYLLESLFQCEGDISEELKNLMRWASIPWSTIACLELIKRIRRELTEGSTLSDDKLKQIKENLDYAWNWRPLDWTAQRESLEGFSLTKEIQALRAKVFLLELERKKDSEKKQ